MTSHQVWYVLGTLLLVLAGIGGLLSLIWGAGYAMYCIEWMHIAAGPVVLVTAVLLALPIGAFIAIGKLAVAMRANHSREQG
jgi:hypothetical protein